VAKQNNMPDVKSVVQAVLASRDIAIAKDQVPLLDAFINNAENQHLIQTIIEHQNRLMDKWKIQTRAAAIVQQSVRLLNGTVGKPYETKVDFKKWGWEDIADFEFEGLEQAGLGYDEKTKQLTGVPTQSGDFKLLFKFKVTGEPDDAPFHQKPLTLIINPDPKSLWKSLPSDKADPYWKEDDVTLFAPLADRHILVSSKRGRSHANVGSFREDDFAFRHFENTGWSLVVVADGAGSAKVSRKGSALACQSVVDFFAEMLTPENLQPFDELVQQHKSSSGADTQKKLNHFVYNNLGKAAFQTHKKLQSFAAEAGVALKDLNTTLVFCLFKKYDVGYALLSFGVGDCPMGVLNRDVSEVTLMNWIDVGEFGGGTRFITMPEIFQSDKFATRFSFKLIDDFSYLILMSDGIYDPKFVVEAALQDMKKWKAFLADLGGKNEEGAKVELDPKNPDIVAQFSAWMDFWSAGNHDDRTLAIVF
jgi:serine/threonine protein phosphatase PrpC